MNTFRCTCGNTLYFENNQCLACGSRLGFLPEHLSQAALEDLGNGRWRARSPDGDLGVYRRCHNDIEHNVCNWMVPDEQEEIFCQACRLNRVIPNLKIAGNHAKWLNVEQQKRRLIYDLLRLGLPFQGKQDNHDTGLAFAFMEDEQSTGEFVDTNWSGGKVFTGHANGLITINILEADDVAREAMRQQMNEASRTLLGHFRHEIGHYFWDRLIRDGQRLTSFRSLFGDERLDYQQALESHYQQGPPADWQNNFISAYAASHPWEDWAECWGHYLQIRDALETAWALGLVRDRPRDFSHLIRIWNRVSASINLMNRSLGLRDAYPYTLTDPVLDKMVYIHDLITIEGKRES
ncbi:zinc-binding metallopeptidase family protein [Natronospira bacteriovora]|uniref:Zinc-binding peptidase n=1 Tax=Natronospira bacteriovora TaxID=3069753 RepID=A0ABU0W7P5_9GAMM|nr:putative zinc-binding peptidase [Natronospira sp. AB-CW4]MDQ2069938.1 putative zinc-binding peptidase [Natronospira sp. AB-CW4]